MNETKRVPEKETKTLNVTTKTIVTKTEKPLKVTKTIEKEPTLTPKENSQHHPPDEDKNFAEAPEPVVEVEDKNEDNDDDNDNGNDNYNDYVEDYDKEKDNDNDNHNDMENENKKEIKRNFEQEVKFKFKRTERNGNTIVIDNLFNKTYSLDRTSLEPKSEWLEVSESFDLSAFPFLPKLVSL